MAAFLSIGLWLFLTIMGRFNVHGHSEGLAVPEKACDSHASAEWVNSENIGSFENCTTITGSIRIIQVSFDGLPQRNIPGITVDHLKALESIREINGFLRIEGQSEHLTDLYFLRNLETIWGHQLASGIALTVLATSIKSLELTSLTNIHTGHVYIANNIHLCFASTSNFIDILGPESQILVQNNMDPAECAADGFVCDEECNTSHGCWGLGPEKCVQCANFLFEDTCISSCDERGLLYDTGNQTCEPCHEECVVSCSGPGPAACHSCRHSQEGSDCVAECPSTKYPDSLGHCMPCHPFCDQAYGCTGPLPGLVEVQPGQNPDEYGGCYRCIFGQYQRDSDSCPTNCLDPNLETCPVGYYMNYCGRVRSCNECHQLCSECVGPRDEDCTTCAFARQGELCTDECDEGYHRVSDTKDCLNCDTACATCDGPTASSCIACKHHRVYVENSVEVNPGDVIRRGDLSYYCVDECPEHKPDTSTDDREISNDSVCVVAGVLVDGSDQD